MKSSYEILSQSLDNITANIPTWEKDKENNQENIHNALNILRNIQSKTQELINQNIKSITPNMENNVEMIEFETKLNIMKQYLHLLLASENPYEEMGCNDLLYKLDNPLNLNDFNDNLKDLINKFKIINIDISISDFNYSYHVTKYMIKFFEYFNDTNFQIFMKTAFDNIYWKNHNILSDISINVHLMLKEKEKIVIEKTMKSKFEFVKQNQIDEKNFKKNYDYLFVQVISLSRILPKRIWDLFNDNKLIIEDYLEDSSAFLAHRNKFVNDSVYNSFSIEQKNQFFHNIEDLDFNLYEYENFEKFKYLINEVIKITEKKVSIALEVVNKNKVIEGFVELNKKNNILINSLEKQKIKMTNKKTGLFFGEKKKEKKLLSITQKIDNQIIVTENNLNQIRIEYDNYDELIFDEKVCKLVNENYSIYDVFKIYQFDIKSLRKTIVKQEKDIIPEEEVTNLVNQFKRFIEDPRIKIINSINYLKTEEIDSIIEEKYKLSGIKVDIVKTSDPVYKDLRKSCEILTTHDYIIRSGWTPLVIKFKLESVDN